MAILSIEELKEQLQALLNSKRGLSNAWYKVPNIKEVYIRTGFVSVDGTMYNRVITIANITVIKQKRGKGVFTAFLKEIESMGYPVYVECVHDYDRFGMLLKKQGYALVNIYSPDYYSTNWFKAPQ